MDGKTLKEKIRLTGKSQRQIAELLGITPQSVNAILSASDVRSGTIEKLANVLHLPISFFYEDATVWVTKAEASGEGSGASVEGDVNIGDSAVLKERIKSLEGIIEQQKVIIEGKEKQINEKDLRIKDKDEMIDLLKSRQ